MEMFYNQTLNDGSNDAKNLWADMVSLKSIFEQQIDEMSRDLQKSFQQTTIQIQVQLSDIQKHIRPHGKEIIWETTSTLLEWPT